MSKKQLKQDTTYITTASGHPIDADVVIINGIKYKRVEELKPETLYNVLRHGLECSIDMCDDIVDAVEEWLPDDDPHDGEEYQLGWNACLKFIRDKLR